MAKNVGKMPVEDDSSSSDESSSSSSSTMLHLSLLSSSSSSSDGLSFVINDLDDEIIFPVVQHLIESEDDPQHLVFLLQLQQAAKELTPSASKPRAKR